MRRDKRLPAFSYHLSLITHHYYWGGRTRTYECRFQRPVPYHLATPQSRSQAPRPARRTAAQRPSAARYSARESVAHPKTFQAPSAAASAAPARAASASLSKTPKTLDPLPESNTGRAPSPFNASRARPTSGWSRTTTASKSFDHTSQSESGNSA